MKQWETFSVATCFIAYENTIKSTGPKWLCWGAWYPKSQSKVEEFKTKSQGNGELVVQHGELCFLFLEDPVKTCLVQKTAICFGPWKKIIHGRLVHSDSGPPPPKNCPKVPRHLYVISWDANSTVFVTRWNWRVGCTNCITKVSLVGLKMGYLQRGPKLLNSKWWKWFHTTLNCCMIFSFCEKFWGSQFPDIACFRGVLPLYHHLKDCCCLVGNCS